MKIDRKWRTRLQRGFALALTVTVLALVIHQARSLDWPEIARALKAYRLETLALTLAFPVVGFVMMSCYDLLARPLGLQPVSRPEIMRIGFISYAFTLNFGTLIGGFAVRHRLYSRHEVGMAVVTQVAALAIVTNWSGYLLFAGLIYLIDPPTLPSSWGVHTAGGDQWLRIVGFAMLVAVMAYLAFCMIFHGRIWHFRKFSISPLPLSRAAAQLAISGTSWSMMGLALNQLLPAEVPLQSTMTGVFVAAVAGLIVRVPAGLGVLEAALVFLLRDYASPSAVLAAALAYRVMYLILPLLLAMTLFALEEVEVRRRKTATGQITVVQRKMHGKRGQNGEPVPARPVFSAPVAAPLDSHDR